MLFLVSAKCITSVILCLSNVEIWILISAAYAAFTSVLTSISFDILNRTYTNIIVNKEELVYFVLQKDISAINQYLEELLINNIQKSASIGVICEIIIRLALILEEIRLEYNLPEKGRQLFDTVEKIVSSIQLPYPSINRYLCIFSIVWYISGNSVRSVKQLETVIKLHIRSNLHHCLTLNCCEWIETTIKSIVLSGRMSNGKDGTGRSW